MITGVQLAQISAGHLSIHHSSSKANMEKACLLPIHDSTTSNASVKCSSLDSIIVKPCNCLKLIGINLLAFGLELCASAGFTYIPPIMLKNGFTDKALTIIMGIGPFISLLLVPIIGRWSDHCQSRFGRRRPFMLALGIIMIFSLLIISYNHEICLYFNYLNPSFGLATGVILLDFSSQALMNPCKALIPDIFPSLKEQNLGFTAYSCMLSMGGCFGYFITSFNWSSTLIGDFFGGQEKAVFSVLAFILTLLLIINLSIAHEKPLQARKLPFLSNVSLDNNFNDCKVIKNSKFDVFNEDDNKRKELSSSKSQKSFSDILCHNRAKKNVLCTFVESLMPRTSFERIKLRFKELVHSGSRQTKSMFYTSFKGYTALPPVLFHLFIACLFGWMGIMCHDMYYTDFVGQVIYKGRPQAQKESETFNLYDEGVRMGSWGLLLHCLSAALYAGMVQNRLISRFGRNKIYMFGMICFTVSLLGTVSTTNLWYVNIFSALSGLGTAAITTVPYALITEYYSKKEVYYKNCKQRGVGEDMAVLDSAVFLSQIIPSLFLGYIVDYTKTSSTYMFVAAACGASACYFSCFITFT